MTDYNLFPAASGPGASTADGPNQYTLGVEWNGTAGTPLWLKGYRFWRADTQVDGPITARTWVAATGSAVVGSDATFTLSGTGWQEVLLPTPVSITPTTRYRSGCHFPDGFYAFTNTYWTGGGPGAGGITNGRIQAPSQSSATEGEQGSLLAGASLSFPANGSPGGANYWVTPIITDTDPGGEFHEGVVSIPVAVAGTVAGAKGGVGAVSFAVAVGGSSAGAKQGAGAVAAPVVVGASVVGADIGGAVVSPVLCSAWATPTDIPDRIKADIGITDAEWLPPLMRASEILWALSGRRWLGGGCEEVAVLRSIPPRTGEATWPYEPSWGQCGCWVHAEWINGLPVNVLHGRLTHMQQPVAVRLPRSPVSSISLVQVGGAPFTAWSFTQSGWLERTDGLPWAVCGGQVEVTYQFGEAPPLGGRDSAVLLAVELAKDMHGIEGCALPTRTTSVTRQNVTVETASSVEVLRDLGTGIYAVDLWVRSVNPELRPQRAGVWSPDVPHLARRFT